MTDLISIFTNTEKKVLEIWKDKELKVLSEINCKCFIINWENKGKYNYEICFGKSNNNDYFEKNKTFDIAIPRRIIKYYQYYLMETMEQLGIWFTGEKQVNGNLEFLWQFDSLEKAFDSL